MKNNTFSHRNNCDILTNMEIKMKLEYTYFEAEEGGYIGYFTDFPQHVTEGETIDELEEMLQDMYESLNLAKYHKRELAIA
jgi:hypothetical protein